MHDVMKGVRILEVAQFTFVPSAGAVLADWGADVIKIEHPDKRDGQRGLLRVGGQDNTAAINKLLRLGPHACLGICDKVLHGCRGPDFMRDFHGAELRAAHGTKMRNLGAFSRQGFIVEVDSGFRVERQIELVAPAELKSRL